MTREEKVLVQLRDRIVSGLHRGSLHSGDRLASIREIAKETGADHRAVAESYRALEVEGLVEIRERSGIFVAEQERLGGDLLSETGRWLATVMAEGWKRRILAPELPSLLRRCTSSVHLHSAFVESNVDTMMAIVPELSVG